MSKAKTKTKQEVKEKEEKETTGTIFEWARGELQKAEDLLYKRKYEIILETAHKLDESGLVETDKITMEIIEGLKGYVDDQYVREVLADYPQYKQGYRAQNAKKRKSKSSSEIRAKTVEGIPNEPETQKEWEQAIEDEDAPTGYYQGDAGEYEIEAVEQYDRAYLIRVVRFQHATITTLNEEIKMLKKELNK